MNLDEINTSHSGNHPDVLINSEQSTPSLIENPEPPNRTKRVMMSVGWVAFTLFCLIFFTLMKLPDDRIKGYIDGQISRVLMEKGITFSSTEGRLSFFFGISYTLKGVTLAFPPPAAPGKIEKLVISPSVLPLIIGRYSGSFEAVSDGGNMSGSVSVKKSDVSISYQAKKFNLGKTGLVSAFTGVQIAGLIDGKGAISGDFNSPSTLDGDVHLQLSKLALEPQSISGFSIPRVNISEGTVDVVFEKGKATLKNFKLGKSGNPADDLQGTITGDIGLGKRWNNSPINLKTRFSLSENILKSFVLLDAILGAGKQADGSYAFNITGTVEAPIPEPVSH